MTVARWNKDLVVVSSKKINYN